MLAGKLNPRYLIMTIITKQRHTLCLQASENENPHVQNLIVHEVVHFVTRCRFSICTIKVNEHDDDDFKKRKMKEKQFSFGSRNTESRNTIVNTHDIDKSVTRHSGEQIKFSRENSLVYVCVLSVGICVDLCIA